MALKANQATAARLAEEQNREWRQLARGRHDIRQIEPQMKQPNQWPAARLMGNQRKDVKVRIDKGGNEIPFYKNNDQMKKVKGDYSWKPGGRNGFYGAANFGGSRDCEGFRKKSSGDERNRGDRRKHERP